MPSIWSAGRYEAVAELIASIAAEVVGAVDRRKPVRDAALVDLACGTGSAALAAAGMAARVTAVDITPELIVIGARKPGGDSVTWVAADASDTGLPGGSYDAVVSNMGIIFVEPVGQVAEISRLLKPGGVVGFSSWVHDQANPFFTPIIEVLGPPAESGHSPDQWGEPETITTRLAADFEDVEVHPGLHTWQFESPDAAMRFVTRESPMHVAVLGSIDAARHDRLLAAFERAMRSRAGDDGGVSFEAPYVVVTARRR